MMKFCLVLSLLMLAPSLQAVRGETCLENSGCGTGHTCCTRFDGTPTCCPLPNAVCCPGGDTCCSSGETCSPDACYKGIWVWPLMKYQGQVTVTSAALGRGETKLNNGLDSSSEVKEGTVCPDGSRCSFHATCCLTDFGYGCCPLRNAVCCPDQEHCCPEDTVCSHDSTSCQKQDITGTSYINNSQVIPSSSFNQVKPHIKPKSIAQVKLSSSSRNTGDMMICPDKSQCVPGATCCKMDTGGYGCCPMPNAVCCKDGQHCCQEGTKCGTHRCITSIASTFINLLQ